MSCDGFDSPVEPGHDIWPAGWRDASPYAKLYFVGQPNEAYHTGADLNYGAPYADKGLPVHAAAHGEVVFCDVLRAWGWVVVMRHTYADGRVYCTRYAHLQNVGVKKGDWVHRGDVIGEIGDGHEGGRTFIPHLHFDIANAVLVQRPGDWPKLNLVRLKRDYYDPKAFLLAHRPNKP